MKTSENKLNLLSNKFLGTRDFNLAGTNNYLLFYNYVDHVELGALKIRMDLATDTTYSVYL